MRFVLLPLLLLLLASCAGEETKTGPEKLTLTPASFDDLKGWQQDTPAAALTAFQNSCTQWAKKPDTAPAGIAGKVAAWQWACAAAAKIPATDDAARAYFEQWFRPYAASGNAGSEGLFTGYYVPELNGSLTQTGAFQTPLYARPTDIISVDLGAFKSDLKGQHILGKVTGQNLVPYDDRAAVSKGSLANRAQPLVWLDDPVGAFFLEIQGSGHIRLTDGSDMSVGYDSTNGRPYVAIGHVLTDKGYLPRPVTMPAIRKWLAEHPDQAQSILNANLSYVFFRRMPDQNVLGAEQVPLTAQRSLAVDPHFVPLGVPLWLDTRDGEGNRLQRLMIAQDTGGAIKGPVRGDFFWGAGDTAATEAGAMQSQGRYFLLLPKTVTAE